MYACALNYAGFEHIRGKEAEIIHQFGTVWAAYTEYADLALVEPSTLCSKSSDYNSISSAFWTLAASSATQGHMEDECSKQALAGPSNPVGSMDRIKLPSTLAAMMVAASNPGHTWASNT